MLLPQGFTWFFLVGIPMLLPRDTVHPSLLPLYRGAAPLQRCLEAGDAVGKGTVYVYEVKSSSPLNRPPLVMLPRAAASWS